MYTDDMQGSELKANNRMGMSTTLPYFANEAIQNRVGVLYVLLRLLPHVEDGTVATRTQDILRTDVRTIYLVFWNRPVPDLPDAKIPDTFGIGSTTARTEPGIQTSS